MADSDAPDLAYERLKARLRTMPVVEQAKGIVMARQGCGPDEAFDLLRRTSQQVNLKVHVLAALLVDQVAGKAAGISHGSEPCGDDGGTTARITGGELIVDGRVPGPDGHQQPGSPPGTVVVKLRSELTFPNAEQVRRDLAVAVDAAASMVVADGTQTVFCDSAGMRELVMAHRRATANGIAFRVVVPHHYLRDRLVRTGLASYLPVYSTLGEALRTDPGSEVPADDLDPAAGVRD